MSIPPTDPVECRCGKKSSCHLRELQKKQVPTRTFIFQLGQSKENIGNFSEFQRTQWKFYCVVEGKQ